MPLVWVVTDLGPTDAPGFLVSAVPVTTSGFQPGQVWADSATPFHEPGTLQGCLHPQRFMPTEDGLLICPECTERFHRDQFPRTDPRLPTGDTP